MYTEYSNNLKWEVICFCKLGSAWASFYDISITLTCQLLKLISCNKHLRIVCINNKVPSHNAMGSKPKWGYNRICFSTYFIASSLKRPFWIRFKPSFLTLILEYLIVILLTVIFFTSMDILNFLIFGNLKLPIHDQEIFRDILEGKNSCSFKIVFAPIAYLLLMCIK